MEGIDVNQFEIAVGTFAAVGLVSGGRSIVAWLRYLLKLEGHGVLWLVTLVAMFSVVMFALTQTAWVVWGTDVADLAGWGFLGAYLICVVAATIHALEEQSRSIQSRMAFQDQERDALQFTQADDR